MATDMTAQGKVYSKREASKIALRRWAMGYVGKSLVIDAFAGRGVMAKACYVGKFEKIICIEKGKVEFHSLAQLPVDARRGDNLNVLPKLLEEFPSPDLIDLDAFGDPWEQVGLVLSKVQLDKAMALVVTDGALMASNRGCSISDGEGGKAKELVVPTKYRAHIRAKSLKLATDYGLRILKTKIMPTSSKDTVLYWACILVKGEVGGRPVFRFGGDDKIRAAQMWAEGRTFLDIAAEIGCDDDTPKQWRHRKDPFDWDEHKAQYLARVTEAVVARGVRTRVMMIADLSKIQDEGMAALDSGELDYNSKAEAAKSVMEAQKQQIVIEGGVADRSETIVNGEVKIERPGDVLKSIGGDPEARHLFLRLVEKLAGGGVQSGESGAGDEPG